MEALAVFGIACNVLQVLGSVEQAIRLGRTIYKKRSVDPELARNIAALNTCIQGLDSSLQNSTDAATQDTKDLVFIAKECLDCGAKTKEQLQKISDLAPVGSRLGVLRAWAAAVTWGKRELDELERTMRARQHVLETQLLVRICKKSDAMTIRSRDSFESLNSTLQSFILACMQGQMTLEKIMESQSESIKDYVFVEANKTRESTKDSICEESHRIYSNISMTLQTMRTAESSKKDRERLSESLRYPSMDSRRNQIEVPQEETFKWIFKSPSHNQYRDSNVRWSDFPNWLRASNSPMPYWVTGKAGSGKSTLMRYLATHERTYDMLSIKGTKITILSHYMWAAGDPLQRSVVGFLCSLLHQLLWDCDALGSLVLSHFKDARRKRLVSDWSRKDLEAVLNFLFSISRESFCLFLDGVDEAEDQTAVIKLVQRLCNIERVRVCLSSRPEPVLRKYFQSYPFLYMQDLTAQDIQRYTKDILRCSSLHLDGQLDWLVINICVKSEGVFLWVRLAVKSLEVGSCYEEKIGALMARLDALPRDLEQLYLAMWTREVEQNPAHQQDASRCLGIMLEYLEYRNIMPSKMDIALMTLMLNPSLATALLYNQGEAEAKRFDGLCEETLQILDLKTAGLLEVGKDYEVRLIHRSAFTFLRESALAQQTLHTDKMMPKQRQSVLMSGLFAYILICLKCRNGSDSDTSKYPADADSVSHQSMNSQIAQLCSTGSPLSYKFCLSQDFRSCCMFLLRLQRYTIDRQLSDSEVRNVLSLAQIVYRSGRWTWGPVLIVSAGLSGVPYRYKGLDPDFIGAAASMGFFDYVWASMKEFYATSPTGMKISPHYEDYILRAADSAKYWIRFRPLSVLRLMQLMADNREPVIIKNSMNDVDSSWEKHRFQISNDVFSKITDYFRQPAPGWSHYCMHRALLGLLYAGYSQPDSMLITLRRRAIAPEDHYRICWTNDVSQYLAIGSPNKGAIFFHTNAKTILLLFLAGVSERLAEGPPLFSDIIAAAENINMPYMFRLIALQPPSEGGMNNENGGNDQDDGLVECNERAEPTGCSMGFVKSFWLAADFCGNGGDTKAHEYTDLKAIKHATMEAVLTGLYSTCDDTHESVSSIVVPGLDHYVREIFPELCEVPNEAFKKLLLENGLLHDHDEWPPQTYVPTETEMGTAQSPS